MKRPPKPFSLPSWIVGRDFPDPNTRLQGTVLSNPAADSRRGRPLQPRPPFGPFLKPVSRPQSRPLRHPRRTLPPAVFTALPPPAPLQSATPPASTLPAPTPATEAPPKQPPSPNPPKTPPAAETDPQPETSNYHSGKCSICNHPDRDLNRSRLPQLATRRAHRSRLQPTRPFHHLSPRQSRRSPRSAPQKFPRRPRPNHRTRRTRPSHRIQHHKRHRTKLPPQRCRQSRRPNASKQPTSTSTNSSPASVC